MKAYWLLFLALPAAASAEEIIVTGSRVPSAPEDIGANVTVLDREFFSVEKPANVADLLRRVVGVHIDAVGGRGGTGSLYLRGADPNYTLVLIDGVRVNDPTNARGGSFDFSLMEVADIERVEIARGPYSAVYGGDALAGVINIVTRRGQREKTSGSLDAMAGVDDLRRVALRAGGPAGAGSWSFGVSDSREGSMVPGNRFESQQASGSFVTELGAATSLVVSGRYGQVERAGFPDDSGGPQFAAIRDTERRDGREAVLGASLQHEVGDATYSFSLGYFDRRDDIDSPGVAPGVRDPFGVPPSVVVSNLERWNATLSGTQRFTNRFTLVYGVDFQEEEGVSDGALDFGFPVPTSFALRRTMWAPFTEARIETAFGLSVQAGLRVDFADGEDSVTSPRLRLAYDIGDSGFRVAGSWGKAYKLPSLYALGHPLVGNPELNPERAEAQELELSQSAADGRWKWSATLFDNVYRQAVDFDPGPPPMLVNRRRVDTQGVELAGELRVAETWWLGANVTHADHDIAGSDAELRSRPEWRGGAFAHWAPTSDWKFSVAATHVGTTPDSSIATGDVRLGAYTRVDVSASWRVSERIETYFAVDNLMDEEYQEFVGFPAQGIAPRIGVELSF